MKKISYLLAMLLLFIPNSKVSAYTFSRLGGINRYETAALINKKLDSDTLILTTGNNFADALCANSLMQYYNAEIHLIDSTLNQNIADILKSIDIYEFGKAIIIGGSGVISKNIEEELKYILGPKNVERIGGKDRYETSELIAKKIFEINPYLDTAFITTGKNFPDALSVSSISATFGYPIILTSGETLGNSSISILNNLTTCYKIGGEAVVSDKIDNLITNKNIEINRLEGKTRYLTNQAVINEFYLSAYDHDTVYLASGSNFPDALVGSALAAEDKAPVILVENGDNKPAICIMKTFENGNIIALGGEGVITNETITLLSNVKNRNIIFKHEDNITFTINQGDAPDAKDIKLVAIDRNGQDCSNTFTLLNNIPPEEAGNKLGYIEFSVTIDKEIYFSKVYYSR